MSIRDFKTSATLFLDALSTFTCSELISYKDFIRYTIITTMVGLDRVTIKKKLITSPEVMEVIHEIHPYGKYMNSLYECKYKEFFESLGKKLYPKCRFHDLYHPTYPL
jgi:26S proteasome regulatory subunit N7